MSLPMIIEADREPALPASAADHGPVAPIEDLNGTDRKNDRVSFAWPFPECRAPLATASAYAFLTGLVIVIMT